ncbi:MAG: lipopolysaccharide heptosyltransferase I [Betaproteobacteria bacterium]|nr:lipopolysaccharide heptosyltransferase I [Betaproteobacteria bacterium]MSQ87888.1 lipopolysaccharide heptosyltransferase I [Betaproteobacteria bacterium]
MPKILFVKTSSLGDVVHHCPAVTDVARYVPGAVIDWVVEEAFAEVAALHPQVRRVIPVALRRWRGTLFSSSTWAEFGAFRAALRSEHYDFVIDGQGLIKSALVAAQARGPKHGFDRTSAREPVAARFYDTRHAVPRALHAVERNRRLAAAALGYALEGACDYGLRAADPAQLQGGGPTSAPYALLLTMTSRDDKLWSEEHWRSLGAKLAARGMQCLLPWGSEEERCRCARIATAIPGAVVPQRMSLTELASLARGAHCVVGVDTGLAHLAAALDVPVVGLYCASDSELTGLYGSGRFANLGSAGQPPAVGEVLVALESLGTLR